MNLYISLEPKPESLMMLRRTTKNFLSNICKSQATELVTAINEAASNCISHARSFFCVYLKIENVTHDRALVNIQVSDYSGKFFNGNDYDPPVPGTCEGKMGVLIMRSTADEIRWISHKRGTTVEMSKLCVIEGYSDIPLSNINDHDTSMVSQAS